jgi:LCP family protein required for cell wall assembly
MNTKRIPLALLALSLVCGGLVFFIASFRPFGVNPKFENSQRVLESVHAAPPTQTATLPPTRLPEVSSPQAHLPTLTPGAVTRIAQAATLDPRSAAATQTAVPAIQTLDAIATRARATPAGVRSDPSRPIFNTTNFLLIGTDTRTADPEWQPNTDVLIVLFLDTVNERAALLSLPRDLVVAIPGQQAFRINSAYHHGWTANGVQGGVQLLRDILQNDFDIRIDHWALIDFGGLNKVIDTFGGITLHVPCALADTIDDQPFTIPAGEVEMDYLTAKRYVQSRYTTSDTSRNYRQQRVLWALAKKAFERNAPDRVPLLYEQLQENIATDMTLFDMLGLVPAVYRLDLQNHPERLRARVLQAPAVYPWISPTGAWLYMPDYDEIDRELDTIFDAPQVAGAQATEAECPVQAVTPPPTDAPTPIP